MTLESLIEMKLVKSPEQKLAEKLKPLVDEQARLRQIAANKKQAEATLLELRLLLSNQSYRG